MDIYARLAAFIPKQSCVLCTEQSVFCVCAECEASLNIIHHRCRSCATQLHNDLHFCGECLTQAPNFSSAYTLYQYDGSCAMLIKQFKFNNRLCIGDFFAHKLQEKYQNIVAEFGEYDAIIPLPLARNRIRKRGYNQTDELLRVVAKKSNIVIDQQSVRRIKATRALSRLNLAERQLEIKDAFSARAMNYQKVLLVDDVMTTGSSMSELAKVVRKAGVQSCDVLTLARA